ncbi:unnamed protein product, partial [Rotaria magnacalcarata]
MAQQPSSLSGIPPLTLKRPLPSDFDHHQCHQNEQQPNQQNS